MNAQFSQKLENHLKQYLAQKLEQDLKQELYIPTTRPALVMPSLLQWPAFLQ